MLLADVFEKFIDTCLQYYGLDPCHYFSSSGLSWDAMLKMAGIHLELISDIDMYLFVEKGMRGGLSYIAKKHSKASNKHMKCYDSSKESKLIMYLDTNNLYGWAMSQYLPYSRFKWLNREEINRFDANPIGENSFDGYVLEVAVEYPDKLHELHNDYPLATEKLEISHNILSNHCNSIANKYDIKFCGVNKLVPNLGNKSKYVFHYRNIHLYLSLGMRLVNVHRVLQFKRST